MRFVPFALALICFVLPFLEVSCQGQKLVTLTGVELVTGKEIERRDSFTGQTKSQKIESNQKFAAALGCLCLAAVLCLFSGAAGKLLPMVAGAATLALFIIGKTSIEAEAVQNGQGAFVCSWLIGFWLAGLFVVMGIAVSGWQLFQAPQNNQSETG